MCTDGFGSNSSTSSYQNLSRDLLHGEGGIGARFCSGSDYQMQWRVNNQMSKKVEAIRNSWSPNSCHALARKIKGENPDF